ncbi:MAG: pyridoxal 5'-phosphate synthase glutaminase subunit PdxT [Candidatus Eremiobacteraeota bacterium]|nr:pyridoxal 5'-phosphate synthase glutaminase subunit PdxT [Candidatus Eremiobacteraeota bacterium]
MTVGVLALQGDVVEHVAAMQRAGAETIPVKTPADLERVGGLVVPGGESTTVTKLMHRFDLWEPVARRAREGMPLWGTCMGMIVVSSGVVGLAQETLGLLDVDVRRNAFGRQNDSAEVDLHIPVLGEAPFPAVFIRAPWIERVGSDVRVLASYRGHGVMVQQGNVLGTSFHPELTQDDRIHAYFLAIVRAAHVGKQRSVA